MLAFFGWQYPELTVDFLPKVPLHFNFKDLIDDDIVAQLTYRAHTQTVLQGRNV